MSNVIQIIPEKIHINSIRILGGNISAEPSFDTEMVSSYDVQYAINDELYLKQKSFKFILSIFINALSVNDAHLGAKGEYNIEYIFTIENLEDYIVPNKEPNSPVVLHTSLLHTLLSIVYSTSRGIVLSRTQGTSIDGVVLPVIDTTSLLKQLLERQKQLEINESTQQINP
jgi:hypothetical protein